jgi:hypothetical protein
LFTKKFVLPGQTVNSAYYCDVLRQLREDWRILLPELWRQKVWPLHHDSAPSHTFFVTREFFTKNNRLSSLPTLLFPVSRLTMKLRCRHFDTVEVIEAELQAVLKTLTERDFQDALRKWQKR